MEIPVNVETGLIMVIVLIKLDTKWRCADDYSLDRHGGRQATTDGAATTEKTAVEDGL